MSELTMKIEDTSVEVSESEDTDLIEQDDEATSPKQAVELVEYVLEELGDVLVNRLLGELAAINDPLEEERAAKAAEAQTLRASHAELQRRVEAQRRVFDVEIDRAIASGQDSDAEAKKEESAELVWNLRGILAQAEVSEIRVKELEAEQQRNYRIVFESAYPEIRQSTVAVSIALSQLLDKVWECLIRYQSASGQSFVKTKHKLDLTPDEYGTERPYFHSLYRWFGVGGKR